MQTQSFILTSLAALVFATSATASDADDWSRLSAVPTGTRVSVQDFGHSTVTATFVTVDDQTLTIHTKRGTRTLARGDVRRVRRERPAAKLAPWLGMGVGGITVGAAASGESDFTGTGRAIWTGVGAGVGALSGALLRRATRFDLVYQSDAPSDGVR